jgi:hypothetical protein
MELKFVFYSDEITNHSSFIQTTEPEFRLFWKMEPTVLVLFNHNETSGIYWGHWTIFLLFLDNVIIIQIFNITIYLLMF